MKKNQSEVWEVRKILLKNIYIYICNDKPWTENG